MRQHRSLPESRPVARLWLRCRRLVSALLLFAIAGCARDAGQAPTTASYELYRLRNLARLHAERQDEEGYRSATESLRAAVALAGADARDHLNLARVLLFTAEAPTAGQELVAARSALGKDASSPDLDYCQGLFQVRTNDRASAIESFRKVTQALPELRQAWYQLGYALERSGKPGEALDAYRRVLELDPRNRAAAYRMVISLRQLGRDGETAPFQQLFDSLPQAGQADPEKCALTEVSLRFPERRNTEPKAATLRWTEFAWPGLSGATLGAVVPLDRADDGTLELLDLSSATGSAAAHGLRILSFPGGVGSILEPFPPDTRAEDACAGDLDNDGQLDVVLVHAGRLQVCFGEKGAVRRFALGPDTPALPAAARHVAVWDVDHDGDLDLVALAREPEVLRNNGDRSFTRLEPAPFQGIRVASTPASGMDAHDLDQGNDLDFVFAGEDGITTCLNRRNGSFDIATVPQASWVGGDASGASLPLVAVEDLNGDAAPDLVVARGSRWAWYRATVLGPSSRETGYADGAIIAPAKGDASGTGAITDLCLSDLDNDGDLDLVLAAGSSVRLVRNGAAGFAEMTPLALPGGASSTLVDALDVDGDGNVELLVTTAAGTLLAFRSDASPSYASWTLEPKGRRDNTDAIGAVVEQYAGALFQSQMVKRPIGVRFGLGTADRAHLDGVRVRWPQGILQAVPTPTLIVDPAGRSKLFQEDGLVASCPFLYGFGPAGWTFLSDCIGIAPLDEWQPPSGRPILDPEEFIRIEGDRLVAADGLLRVSVAEELRETTYLDRAELIAVDHPVAKQVFLDESTNHADYEPLSVYVIASDALMAPASVRLEDGSEASPLVREADARYVHGYQEVIPQWAGWVPEFHLDVTPPRPASLLLLTGRIHWYDSTVSFALYQHGRHWGPFELQSLASPSSPRLLVPDLGVPAGMDRTLVASYTDRPSAEAIRLSAHHRFLWDRIQFAERADRVDFGETLSRGGMADSSTIERGGLVKRSLSLRRAVLGWHGYSRLVGDKERHEQTYDYDDAAPSSEFGPARGLATRYGEVTPLVRAHDDHLVVVPAGDECVLYFDAGPAPRADSQRTYFLRLSAWAKEGSYHNRTGDEIGPLPFRSMSGYPPPAGEAPRDAAYLEYLAHWQTREVRGRFGAVSVAQSLGAELAP